MTIQETLLGSGLPQSEARILLAHAQETSPTWLLAHPEEEAKPKAAVLFQRRLAGEPIAYITGTCEFYGRTFSCNPSTLIPRPRTELLVEDAIKLAQNIFSQQEKPCPVRVLELGTGTGCISISLALELAGLGVPTDILATDISADALGLARQNWQRLGASLAYQRIRFVESDLLEKVSEASFDLLVANLPYVEDSWSSSTEAPKEVIAFEPDSALYAGSDGLDCYRRLHAQLKDRMRISSLLLECADLQKSALSALFLAEITDYGVCLPSFRVRQRGHL